MRVRGFVVHGLRTTDYGLPVRENANFGRRDDVTILLFRPKIAKDKRKKIYALKKLDSRFHRSISENFKASLSNVPWARVGNFWQSESIKSLSFWKGLWRTAAILIAIECKYMLLCAFFNSLPNFLEIETNFPRNYNKLALCRQSFIGGNKLKNGNHVLKIAVMRNGFWQENDWKFTHNLSRVLRVFLRFYTIFR